MESQSASISALKPSHVSTDCVPLLYFIIVSSCRSRKFPKEPHGFVLDSTEAS